VLENWAIVEADFQREYQINLICDIKTMNWRRFIVLLTGLSPDSLWHQLNSNDNSEQIIEDPKMAERAVNNIWK